jgi:hypothetical protein
MRRVRVLYRKLVHDFVIGKRSNFGVWIVLLIGCIALFILPWLFTRNWGLPSFSETGSIGDTVNGIATPFIAIAAAILTFVAFWVQYQSNLNQVRQFRKQDLDTQVQRFESRFFELIKLHRDNVAEINIENKIKGRKAFSRFYYELRYIYVQLELNYESSQELTKSNIVSKHELTNIAFLLFFFGVGENSNKMHNIFFKRYEDCIFLKNTIKDLETERNKYNKAGSNSELNIPDKKGKDDFVFVVNYKPFNGHGGKLGHYFRHLFHIVKFVDEQSDRVIKNKDEYLKVLRAQLSNFEQLLLYYNSISVLGSNWNINRYISKYKMIKNIPIPLADFGGTPIQKYEGEIKVDPSLFQWLEIENNIESI